MSGLATGLGIAALAAGAKSAIDYADKLNDLSKRTGIAVETLGGLGYAAKTAGVDIDSVAKGVGKMQQALYEAATGNKEMSTLFKGLGIDISKGMGDVEGTLLKLSDRFSSMSNPTEKAALAMKVFGKAGAELIPLLDEGSEKLGKMIDDQKRYGGVTAETAAAADQFNDTVAKLEMLAGSMYRQLAEKLLPTLQGIAEVFLSFKEKGSDFSTFGEAVSAVLKAVAAGALTAKYFMEELGRELGALSAAAVQFMTGNFKAAKQIMAENAADIGRGKALLGERLAKIFDGVPAEVQPAARKAGKSIVQDLQQGMKQGTDELRGVLNKIFAKDVGIDQSFVKDLAELNFGFAQGRIDVELYATAVKKLIEQQKPLADLIKEETKAMKAGDDQMTRWRDDYIKLTESTKAMVAGMEFELSVMGLSNAEREIAIKLRDLENQGIKKGSEAYEEIAPRIRAVVVEGQRLRDQQATWDELASRGSNFFTDLLTNGRAAFKNLGEELKNFAKEMLALFAKRWILNMVGQGGMASQQGAGTLAGSALNMLTGGGGSLLSTVGSLFGSSAFGTGIQGATLAQGLAGPTTVGAGGLTGAGATLADTFMKGLLKLGPWGWVGAAIVGGMVASNRLYSQGYTSTSAGSGVSAGFNPELATDKFLQRLGMSGRAAAILTGSPIVSRLFAALGMGGENWKAQLGFGGNAQAYTNQGGLFGAEGFHNIAGNDENNRKIQDWMAGVSGQLDSRLAAHLTTAQIGSVSNTLQGAAQREFAFGSRDTTSNDQLAREYLQQKYGTIFDLIDKTFADEIRNFTGSGEDLAKEIDAFTAFMDSLGEMGIAGLDIESLRGLQLEGEKLGDTLGRVMTVFQVTSLISDASFGAVGAATLAARQQLVDFAGGLDAFTQSQQSFYDNFYTAEEKRLRLEKQMSDAFEEHGMKLPATRAAYRALVEAQDLSTEEGRKMYAFLISLGGAFADLVPALDDVKGGIDNVVKASEAILTIDWGNFNQQVQDATQSWLDNLKSLFSDDTFEKNSTRQMNAIQERINANQEYLRTHSAQNYNPWTGQYEANTEYLRIQAEMTRLQGAMGVLTGDLARYYVLEAQYSGHGAQLLELEKWYDQQKLLLGGNNAALLALEEMFAKRRTEILATGGQETINRLQAYLRGSLLNQSLSPLGLTERKDAAFAEYQRLLALAQGGNVDAINTVGSARDTFLTLLRQLEGSNTTYNAWFAKTFDELRAIAGGGPTWQTAMMSAMPRAGETIVSGADLERSTDRLVTGIQMLTVVVKTALGQSDQAVERVVSTAAQRVINETALVGGAFTGNK